MIDLYTFGNTKAAQSLVKILDEPQYKKFAKKVSRYLAGHNEMLNAITIIPDFKQRKKLLEIYRNYAIPTSLIVPELIKSHMYNVLIGNIRWAQQS